MKKIFQLFPLLLLGACAHTPAPAPLAAAPAADTAPVVSTVSPSETPPPPAAMATPEKNASVRPAQQAVSSQVAAQTPPPALPAPEPAPAENIKSWDELLQQHVSSAGKVNYKGFLADRASLDACTQFLSENPPESGWSRAEKMAFWINAYNAFTIRLMVDNYPLSSIMNLDGGKTWDVKRINIGGKKYSLNEIENDILRPQFKDARIHFVLNCAARSCPPLYNRALNAANLESVLEERTRSFINNSRYNTLSVEKCSISKIFEWYAADFGNLRAFLSRYAGLGLNDQTLIEYNDYNWSLNE